MKPSTRALRFVAVGWLGFGVQAATLMCLTALARWPWLPATCAAVEAAIVHNYFWHERWTWRDRAAMTSIGARCARFLRYNVATGLVSIGGNVLLTGLFLALFEPPTLLANVLAVLTMTVANFFVADRLVWNGGHISFFLFARPPQNRQARSLSKGVAKQEKRDLTPALLTAALVLAPAAASAQPSAETIRAWDQYVAQAEARLEWPRRPSPPDRPVRVTEGVSGISGETIGVPSGAIHHWRGTVFVPGATLDGMIGELLNPRPDVAQPEDVAEWRILSTTDDTIRTYMKLVRRAIVTVTYDTEHEMTFRRWSPALATSRSVATQIREQDGGDRGFLWRLNSYWRYQAVPGGVVVELESITLSRRVPAVIRPVAMPIVHRIARESMARTLTALSRRFQS